MEQQRRKYARDPKKKKVQQKIRVTQRESGGFDLREMRIDDDEGSDSVSAHNKVPNFHPEDFKLIEQI